MSITQLEGVCKLKNFVKLIWTDTVKVLACSIALQTYTYTTASPLL
jgi:hypothetical protein